MRCVPMLMAVALVASCSSDDDTTAPSSTSTTPVVEVADTTLPAECALPTVVEVRLRGDGARIDFDVVDAAAVRTRGGVSYTVFLADFAFPVGHDWRFGAPAAPEGNALLTTGLDYFDVSDVTALVPVATGDSGQLVGETAEDEIATFLRADAETAAENTIDQAGITEVLAVTRDDICLHTDIRSANGIELVGTFVAPILADR